MAISPPLVHEAPVRPRLAQSLWEGLRVTGVMFGLGFLLFYVGSPVLQGEWLRAGGGWLSWQSLLACLLLVRAAVRLCRRQPLFWTALHPPALALVAVFALSTAFSLDPRISLERLIDVVLLALCFAAIVDWLSDSGSRERVRRALAVYAALWALVALWQVLDWYSGGGRLNAGSGWAPVAGLSLPAVWKPATLPFENQNTLAAVCVLAAGPILAGLGLATGRGERWIAGWLLIPVALTEVLTFSRAGWLGAVVVAVTYWGLAQAPRAAKGRPWRRWLLLVGGGLLAAGGLGVGAGILRGGEANWGDRLQFLWPAGLSVWLQHPVLGAGPGLFGQLLLAQVPAPSPGYPVNYSPVYDHPHNVFIHLLAEVGLAGLIAFAVAVVVLALLIWRQRQAAQSRAQRLVVAAYGAALAGFGATNLFDGHLRRPVVILWLLLLCGLLLAPGATALRRGRWPALSQVVIALTAVAVLAASVLVGQSRAAYLQANADANIGRWSEAAEQYRTLADRDPAWRFVGVSEGIALAFANPPRTDEAIAALRGALASDPTFTLARVNLAALLAQAGQAAAAVAELETAVRLDPVSRVARLNLGARLEAQGNEAGAVEQYAQLLAEQPAVAGDPFWRASPRRVALWESAGRRAESLLRARMPAVSASGLVAELRYAAGDTAGAWAALAEQPTATAQTVYVRGLLLAPTDPEQALAAWHTATTLDRSFVSAYLAQGRLLRTLGREAEAERPLSFTSVYQPVPAYWLWRGDQALAAGDSAAALKAYRQALPTEPYISRVDPHALVVANTDLPQRRLVPGVVWFTPSPEEWAAANKVAQLERAAGRPAAADDLCAFLRQTVPYQPLEASACP